MDRTPNQPQHPDPQPGPHIYVPAGSHHPYPDPWPWFWPSGQRCAPGVTPIPVWEGPDTWRIGWDEEPGPHGSVVVSTVFLGLDHALGFHPYGDDPPPVLWETMIFYPPGDRREERQRRYITREAARDGHATAVMLLRADLSDDWGTDAPAAPGARHHDGGNA